MPDDGRFSDEELEQRLRDLGARMEYPPTPDVAGTVRRELDEEARSTRPRRSLGWPPFLTPRWTAAAAALLVICAFALSPTLRSTLSSPFTTGFQAGPEAGSAAKPEGNASGDRYKQEEAAGAPAADQGEAARACSPPLSRPYQQAPRPGRSFDSAARASPPAATRTRPHAKSESSSSKTTRPGVSQPSPPTATRPSKPAYASPPAPNQVPQKCRQSSLPANARKSVSRCSRNPQNRRSHNKKLTAEG